MGRIELVGVDGGNLLAWLAAVGTLRTLAAEWPELRMRWEYRGGWHPTLEQREELSQDAILDALEQHLPADADDPRWTFGLSPAPKDVNLPPEQWHALLAQGAHSATQTGRDALDAWTAYASDCRPAEKAITKTASGFVAMFGQGHQHFLGSLAELATGTTRDHLARTLFAPWDYADGRPSMRWDAMDDRRYALRADDPSKSKAPLRTMRGANRLAVEALPWLPVFPGSRRAEGCGWEALRGGEKVFRWPIWSVPLSAIAARTLVGHRQLAPEGLEARGVAARFEARRISVGKFTCFTASRGL